MEWVQITVMRGTVKEDAVKTMLKAHGDEVETKMGLQAWAGIQIVQG